MTEAGYVPYYATAYLSLAIYKNTTIVCIIDLLSLTIMCFVPR